MWGKIRPSWAEVDLQQFAQNLAAIKAQAKEAEVLPVVKANAYGHGDVACSRMLVDLGFKRLAVAIIDEALLLRHAGISCDIVVLGYTPPSQVEAAIANRITLTIFDDEVVAALEREAAVQRRSAYIHIKVETGMNRIGVRPGPELVGLLERIQRMHWVVLEGIFTHFAAADEVGEFTKLQLEEFCLAGEMVEAAGFSHVLKHAANSAGVLDHPASYLDLVRPGLVMYGYYPSPSVSRSVEVSPPLAWYARIVQVKQLQAGDTVGYNRTYRVDHPTQIATLPVGYADGYPRLLSGCGRVYVGDLETRVVGRVCMDQMMIDVSHVPSARPGTICTLLGPHHNAEDMSQLAGTIPHEILTGISPRVPRVYKGAADSALAAWAGDGN